ncbi:MAG: type II toxin-antitoxin system VapC family toxin [Nitrospira sp.]|nr:type II toxin-antitoxin system VapC family toxin [Nitrospira sp.]
MYLVDTNVWLERLLEQERSSEVRRFLDSTETSQIFLTDFSFHSIGLILTRLNKSTLLLNFVQDTLLEGAVSLVHLAPEDTQAIVAAMQQFRLDFDDAYQYVAADKHNLVIVSFDADFDRTERGRKTPQAVLQT